MPHSAAGAAPTARLIDCIGSEIRVRHGSILTEDAHLARILRNSGGRGIVGPDAPTPQATSAHEHANALRVIDPLKHDNNPLPFSIKTLDKRDVQSNTSDRTIV